jgi:hypothetical protein
MYTQLYPRIWKIFLINSSELIALKRRRGFSEFHMNNGMVMFLLPIDLYEHSGTCPPVYAKKGSLYASLKMAIAERQLVRYFPRIRS